MASNTTQLGMAGGTSEAENHLPGSSNGVVPVDPRDLMEVQISLEERRRFDDVQVGLGELGFGPTHTDGLEVPADFGILGFKDYEMDPTDAELMLQDRRQFRVEKDLNADSDDEGDDLGPEPIYADSLLVPGSFDILSYLGSEEDLEYEAKVEKMRQECMAMEEELMNRPAPKRLPRSRARVS